MQKCQGTQLKGKTCKPSNQKDLLKKNKHSIPAFIVRSSFDILCSLDTGKTQEKRKQSKAQASGFETLALQLMRGLAACAHVLTHHMSSCHKLLVKCSQMLVNVDA